MFEKVKAILVKELEVSNPDSITADTVLGEQYDSLALMQAIMALEDEFQMTVEDEDINKLRTVGDIVAYVESKVK